MSPLQLHHESLSVPPPVVINRTVINEFDELFGYYNSQLSSTIQYCAKVMRAKCANFVLCLRELLKKIRPKIQASFCNVLSVISLKQRTKICRIFMTRTKFPSQRDNSACSMRNIAVHCADQYQAINVPFSREQSRSP